MVTLSARWRALACSEAPASCCASAASHGFSKDVGVLAIVESELKFREVKGQVLLGDMMIGSDNAALEQAPEVFQIVSMHFAAHILARAMADRFMAIAKCFEIAIATMLISGDQINFIADRLTDEPIQGSGVRVLDYLADHVALAGNRADYAYLTGADTASDVRLLVPVAVLVLPAKERLIYFHDAHQLSKVRFFHRGPQAMTHIPSRLVGSGTDLPLNLHCADALLGIEHLPQHLKPRLQRVLGILENGPADDAKAVVVAKLAKPVERPRLELVDGGVAASWTADDAILPAMFHQELLARFAGRDSGHQFSER